MTVMALTCFSCQFTHENNGYPSGVSFEKKGGTIKISGEKTLMSIEINEKDGHAMSMPIENDSNCLQYKWLSVKWRAYDENIYITAEPNTTKKNRKIKLYGYVGYEYAVITVSQKH